MTDRRPPNHLAILVGISAGAYAVSLAGMTALQSASDLRLEVAREPFRVAVEHAASTHDQLEAALAEAIDRYGALSERYARVGIAVTGMEGSLDALAERAAGLTDAAASLPSRITLPAVPGAPRAVPVPKTQATTGASG